MPHDTEKPLFEFAEIPPKNSIFEPLPNKGLIFLQIPWTRGLTRPSHRGLSINRDGPVIRTANISTFFCNRTKIYIGRRGQYLAHPWPIALVECLLSWHRGAATL